MGVQQLLQSLVERMPSGATVKAVYGEPVVAEGKTIIPVAKVGFGFGCGTRPGKPDGDKPGEEGGGVGMGIKPIGVVEIAPERTRFISFGIGKKLAAAVIAGLLVGMLIGRRR
jgi:uncharacterized spore protein YtfJ